MYRYSVLCWIAPKSGHQVINRNKLMERFREELANKYPNNEDIEKAVDRFDLNNDGMVLKSFVLDSDAEITDCATELMPEIFKEHPEAKLLMWERIPHLA